MADTKKDPHFMMQGQSSSQRPAQSSQASHQAIPEDLLALLPQSLRQQCQHGQQAAEAAAALGIDLSTIWQLARPQLEALAGIILQALLAKLAAGGNTPTPSPSVPQG